MTAWAFATRGAVILLDNLPMGQGLETWLRNLETPAWLGATSVDLLRTVWKGEKCSIPNHTGVVLLMTNPSQSHLTFRASVSPALR